MTVTTDFCGGNAHILEVNENCVYFKPDLRDTNGNWFYWAFAVQNAAGKTLDFVITDCSPNEWIGPYGAAVSHDLVQWNWMGSTGFYKNSFQYTFAENENTVYFAHDMLYHPSQFYRFCKQKDIPVQVLSKDRHGTPIPHIRVGKGENVILFTARHHCCESTGNYVLEGIVDEFLRDPMPGWAVEAIPFVDADGVIAGDQGKNRIPHDHYLDYLDGLYPGVKAVKAMIASENIRAIFDLHSPWHFIDPAHPHDAHAFLVLPNPEKMDAYNRLSHLFKEECTSDGLIHEPGENKLPGVGWNHYDEPIACSNWCDTIADVEIALGLETTYFGDEKHIVSQKRLLETGRCFMRAVRRFF